MNPLQSLPDYEHFVYTRQKPWILRSTWWWSDGEHIAVLSGELEFHKIGRSERLSFAKFRPIRGYGYEVWRNEEQLYWYDCNHTPMIPGQLGSPPQARAP